MKIAVFSCRPDERNSFARFAGQYGVELALHAEPADMQNAGDARGCPCASILTSPMPRGLLRRLYDLGVRYVSTRSIGYDHIDLRAAKEIGLHVGNVSYTPDSVADYTVMLLLMAVRRVRAILLKSAAQDFSLAGVQGTVLSDLTVGVVGTGRIGRAVIRRLSAFGCRILAYDLHESEEVKKYAQYVPLDRLLAESSALTLHMPATKENFHFVRRETLAKMKDGVILVNTARGTLIDTDALIEGVESGKVGGAALDVVEGETGIFYHNREGEILGNRGLAVLQSFPNVIVTPHTAFYTGRSVSDMVENSIRSCLLFAEGKKNPWQIV